MQSMELPLVLFTVLSQTAIGLTMMRAIRAASRGTTTGTRKEWIMIAGLLIGSLFHLGHPLSAPPH